MEFRKMLMITLYAEQKKKKKKEYTHKKKKTFIHNHCH